MGPPTRPELLETLSRKGRALTHSYETVALGLAADWIKVNVPKGDVLICTDSKGATTGLLAEAKVSTDVAETARKFDALTANVCILWVPGHDGVPGNELADAKAAADHPRDIDTNISLKAATAAIKRTMRDHPPTKPVLVEIYGVAKDAAAAGLTRREAVILAQLRSGHCRALAAYRVLINPGYDPTCPDCRQELQTLEHWFTFCPAIE